MKLPPWFPGSRKQTTYNQLGTFEQLLQALSGGRKSNSGEVVNWRTAIQVSTVFAAAREIANGIAQVPLKLYLDNDEQRDHPLWDLLARKPNAWQTSFDYRTTIALHLVLMGKHYSYISRNAIGSKILELIPIEPHRVTVRRAADLTLTYDVQGADRRVVTYPASSIWHLMGPSWDSWQGLEPVMLAREAIGLALATEQQHAKLHANGAKISGTYSVEGKLSPEQYKLLRQHIIDNTTGERAGLPLIVDNGAKWLQQAMSGVDAQHLETRRFQVEEVCRMLGILPIMVGHSDKATTYASAEAMFQAHVTKTLTPYYTSIELSIGCHLISEEDARRGLYAKFIAAGLLRGSMKDQAEYLSRLVERGILTRNEARAKLELPPLAGLDVPLTPSNLSVGAQPAPAQ